MDDKAIKEVFAEEATRLAEDMKKVRAEELRLHAKDGGEARPAALVLELTAADGTEKALRAIVAARAFDGKLLGAVDNVTEVLKDIAGDVIDSAGGEGSLKLKNVNQANLRSAIDFMYTGSCQVDADNVYALLRTAKSLRLPGLQRICACFLKSSECKASTVCKVLREAHECEAQELKDHCFKSVIDGDTQAVIDSSSFLELPRDLMTEFLQRPSLNVDELKLFDAVIEWGAREKKRLQDKAQASAASPSDAPAEEDSVPAEAAGAGAADMRTALQGVIDHVRFPLIPPEILQDKVYPKMQQVYEDAPLPEKLILEAYQHHALIRIGQPSKIEGTARTTRRTGSASHDGSNAPQGSAPAVDPEKLKRARAAASRTYRWLQGLPSHAERLSMSGMQLSENDAYVLGEHLSSWGAALTELDLKCNALDRRSVVRMYPLMLVCALLARGPAGGHGGNKRPLSSRAPRDPVTRAPRPARPLTSCLSGLHTSPCICGSLLGIRKSFWTHCGSVPG